MNVTLESHLKKLSEEDGNKLYSSWMVIKDELCGKLETVSNYFQHFSLHNATHSQEICNNIERFLGKDRIEKLSATDTWMLLMAFYSHDVGMALKYDDIINTFEEEKFKDELKSLIEGNNDELRQAAERVLAFDNDSKDLKPLKGKALDIFRDVQLIIEEHYRRGHALRSAEYIGKFLTDRHTYINSRMIELIQKICIAHEEDINNIGNLQREENGMFQDYIHPRFVAGMLCLGDLLDMDTNRFSKYGVESASTMAHESELHLKKHQALKHFLIKPDGIEIEMDSPDMEVHRVARDWVEWIDETIKYLTSTWSTITPEDFGNPPKLKAKKLLIKGSELFNGFADLRFTIDQNKALEILQGARIYDDKFVCLREVIQNAVDSSLIQLWKDIDIEEIKESNKGKTGSDEDKIINFWTTLKVDEENKEIAKKCLRKFSEYDIEACIYVDDENRVIIEVSDKGTGVSNESLKAMANIGTKKDKRTDKDIIKDMPGWMRPSGQFGLGLQSIFLISNKFEMITKCENENGKRIIFESGQNNKGYITVEEYNRRKRGTTVKIIIDESKISGNDIGLDELSLKLKDKYEWIKEFIINKVKDNKFLGKEIFNNKNYFNINIDNIKKEKDRNNLYRCEYLFKEDEFIEDFSSGKLVLNENKSYEFKYFDAITKSIIHIKFKGCCFRDKSKDAVGDKAKDKIKDKAKNETEDEDKIVEYNQTNYNETNKIFFKNIYICNFNDISFNDFTFSLNVLDNKADEFLKIDRKEIREGYKTEFISLVMDILKRTFEAIYNYILNSGIENFENKYFAMIYQILRYFDLDYETFKASFKEILDKLYYEETFMHMLEVCENLKIKYTMNQFENRKIKLLKSSNKFMNVFEQCNDEDKKVIEDIEEDDVEKITAYTIEKYNKEELGIDVDKYYLRMSYVSNSPIHLQKTSVKIVKYDGDLYEAIEYTPFLISENQEPLQCDNLYLIYYFMKHTIKKDRDMEALKNFKNLVIKERVRIKIKLPFDNKDYEKIIEAISSENGVNTFNKEEFKKSVKGTEYFKYLVEYVANKNNLTTKQVDKEYENLIDQYLALLIKPEGEDRNPYENFVKPFLKQKF